ncbi:hypothetical protein EDD76_116101 [Kineothrix alysoides]|uniref:Tail sheath protein C-terminal domain-containing protein n=1 Tax=Kineothrix alysoides TaxID=1469948 RepID=A0A4R1QQL4_9FIRM|nr:phage tail sheath subtilisin-like domain-containing protein [Kineothrix alysoides]TCL55261.1 hypothetical protein EDD76_116101 [Kineothrix alysoides]
MPDTVSGIGKIMSEYLSPGVYVEEFDSGPMPIEGVSTSITGFIGLAERGPVGGLPVPVSCFGEFRTIFGYYLPENQFGPYCYLAYAVEHYFANGGSRCYISRVVPEDAKMASCILEGGQMRLTAKAPGAWGNKLSVSFKPSAPDKFDITIRSMDIYMEEVISAVSFNPDDSDYIANKLTKSKLVSIEVNTCDTKAPSCLSPAGVGAGEFYSVTLSEGSDGSVDAVNAKVFTGKCQEFGKRTGLQAFLDNKDVSIIAIPGITDVEVQKDLIAHCDKLGNRFAVLDLPQGKNSVADVQSHREIFNSPNAAFYHPWIEISDPLMKRSIFVPPSGAVAGIYSRTDDERGVHKAPANEVVRGCTGVEYMYSQEEQDRINPGGINLIRVFPGMGIRVWGARTCSSDSVWKYVNVRRLFIFLEESIRQSITWAIFEQNNQILWARMTITIGNFLTSAWRSGMLAGVIPDEAFFIKADKSTMTSDDIDNGRFICLIGVAVAKPAEFITFTIVQKTGTNDIK